LIGIFLTCTTPPQYEAPAAEGGVAAPVVGSIFPPANAAKRSSSEPACEITSIFVPATTGPETASVPKMSAAVGATFVELIDSPATSFVW
jgi:hypothetical protein